MKLSEPTDGQVFQKKKRPTEVGPFNYRTSLGGGFRPQVLVASASIIFLIQYGVKSTTSSD